MSTTALASAIAGFLLGGLTVSVAAELEDHPATRPAHGSVSQPDGPGLSPGPTSSGVSR